jgi:plastocyanin
MKRIIFVIVFGFGLHYAVGGTISGTVSAKGPPLAAGEDGPGNYQSKKYKFADQTDWSAVHDFVVFIDGPIAGTKPPSEPSKVEQKGVEFIPHVLPIMVGTSVDWPNDDDIFHNVFSKSPANQFNLGLYKKGDAAKRLVFDKPGEVDVFCAIHAKMSCIILVLENPYFAKTDEKGRFAIPNVPAGKYRLVAWQERLFSQTNEITVGDAGEIKSNFTLGPDGK